mmetsp:Transcript_3962/g.6200  ORF Transcript_3962/g.6200 Transcript_3962/m.6200 type:complete len:285 (-) Transcript_3962:170-1024(-)|eukprot:CAMPEP_0185022828 /NCGR_PEP_ID=MMETSP1103-20130426/5532_1 /TAXON_ID=36769 /ORGANISM="Paraphysomonas bandaiensis, Strain Caron Lab Isolate" /LENGTH=284 /DNA_ID=CAMNT_0027555087 /DNA_START=225 /DNA_END=1079 /DNA_ORIENTATION=+
MKNLLTPESIDFIAGSVAGAISIVVGQPFDTIKVRLQTTTSYKGPVDCVKRIIKAEGFSSLFSGMLPPLMTSVFVNAIIFTSYGYTLRLLKKGDDDKPATPSQMFLAGMTAGFCQSWLMSPSELIKIRLQSAECQYRGTLHAARDIIRTGGITGIYRGYVSTLYREVPAFGAYFMTYYCMMDAIDDKLGDVLPSFIAGGAAGAVSWIMIYPIDIAKTKIQMSDSSPRSTLVVLKDICRVHGLRYLYRGLGTTIVRSLPVNAVVFPVYEFSSAALNAFVDEEDET